MLFADGLISSAQQHISILTGSSEIMSTCINTSCECKYTWVSVCTIQWCGSPDSSRCKLNPCHSESLSDLWVQMNFSVTFFFLLFAQIDLGKRNRSENQKMFKSIIYSCHHRIPTAASCWRPIIYHSGVWFSIMCVEDRAVFTERGTVWEVISHISGAIETVNLKILGLLQSDLQTTNWDFA